MANSHTTTSADNHLDIEVELASIDCLLAGTFALMTGYAEHSCSEGNTTRRGLLAKKIVANLALLAEHPRNAGGLSCVFLNLQQHWHTMVCLDAMEYQNTGALPATGTPTALWLSAHHSLQ